MMQPLKKSGLFVCVLLCPACYQPVEARAAVSLRNPCCLLGHVNVLMLKNALVNINSPGW